MFNYSLSVAIALFISFIINVFVVAVFGAVSLDVCTNVHVYVYM